MLFIHRQEVPQDRFKVVTYSQIVCENHKHKVEKNRTRLMVGGNLINYPDDCGTLTADLLTVNILLNSIISTAGEESMSINIKNIYLNTPLKRF